MKRLIASISCSSLLTTLSTKPSAPAATASSPPAPQPPCPNQISPHRIQRQSPRPRQPSPRTHQLFPATDPPLLIYEYEPSWPLHPRTQYPLNKVPVTQSPAFAANSPLDR